MKKMKDLPKDVKSKLGARFQEGQVRRYILLTSLAGPQGRHGPAPPGKPLP